MRIFIKFYDYINYNGKFWQYCGINIHYKYGSKTEVFGTCKISGKIFYCWY